VASPNTAWGVFRYDEYRRRAGSAPGPRDYAQGIAAAYAEAVAQLERPYTISVLDMTQFELTNAAISNLGYALAAYTAGNRTRTDQVRRIRDAGQFYHSGVADTLEPGPHDYYVDLLDFVMRVQTNLTDTAVISAAQAVSVTLAGHSPFIVWHAQQSGAFDYSWNGVNRTFNVQLDRAHGLGIFYPPAQSTSGAYRKYITNQLFNITRDSGWSDFLNHIPDQGATPLEDTLISTLIRPEYRVYLPLVRR